jgi:hypothetical protein
MSGVRDEKAEKLNRTVNDRALSKRLALVGWGLFLVWIGIVKIADLPPGAVLLGVGAVTLGIQGARAFFSLPLEGFWVVAGAIFAASGLVKLVGGDFRFLPFLLVAAGAVLVVLGIRGRLAKDGEGTDR